MSFLARAGLLLSLRSVSNGLGGGAATGPVGTSAACLDTNTLGHGDASARAAGVALASTMRGPALLAAMVTTSPRTSSPVDGLAVVVGESSVRRPPSVDVASTRHATMSARAAATALASGVRQGTRVGVVVDVPILATSVRAPVSAEAEVQTC